MKACPPSDSGWLTGVIYGREDANLLGIYTALRTLADAQALTSDEAKAWVAVNRRLEILTGGTKNTELNEALRGALNNWDLSLLKAEK